jgi:hypothetical protein
MPWLWSRERGLRLLVCGNVVAAGNRSDGAPALNAVRPSSPARLHRDRHSLVVIVHYTLACIPFPSII